MKSWNTKIVNVEQGQYGPKLVFLKKDGSQSRMDLGCDVPQNLWGTEVSITVDDSGQYWKCTAVGPPQAKSGGGYRGSPKSREEIALNVATAIMGQLISAGVEVTDVKVKEILMHWHRLYKGALKMQAESPAAPAPTPQAPAPTPMPQAMREAVKASPPEQEFNDDIPF